MISKMEHRNYVALLIIDLIKKDPEAFQTINSALNQGIQEALDDLKTKANTYYSGMQAALILADSKRVSPDLKKLMSEQIVEATKGKFCGISAEANAKYSQES